ncbi:MULTISPECIES: A24 family peptidase [unclassified Synechocystis]|uniref:prepilin peptidase n=1 Tax=unclassified Synechocystis TaxID=2640012 RepID=UPI0004218794|nr:MULTISPECIES: A24 family peptidase [unclassified Synechocystis]AIE73365.1 Leader peptidase (Prepilin peptidase) / N-methyltransferase [Synechocystis sp. PCC 6714]MCT0253179.1 A24 family peptidase [Synechocystis sp. CS-94]
MDSLLVPIVLLFVIAFGCAVGSFLNVVAYRLPAGLSLVHPPSRCPHCGHSLGPKENVPVLGWLWLRGKCRWCQTRISPRYPLVEATTGLLFALIFSHFGWQWETLGYWTLISFLIALTLIDWDTMTLPNRLTKPGLVVGLLFHLLLGWQSGNFIAPLIEAIASAVLGLWLFDLIRMGGSFLLGKEGMGDGDPKLAAMVGAWLGWQSLLLTTFIACLIGSIYGGLKLLLGTLQRRQSFPFGPFLAIGAMVSLFWGEKIIASYLNFVAPQF